MKKFLPSSSRNSEEVFLKQLEKVSLSCYKINKSYTATLGGISQAKL